MGNDNEIILQSSWPVSRNQFFHDFCRELVRSFAEDKNTDIKKIVVLSDRMDWFCIECGGDSE